MNAEQFDRMARLLFAVVTRRTLTQLLAGLGVSATLAPIRTDDAVAKKKCDPCRTKKQGKCKRKKPNGTPCPGGQCFNGVCNRDCCGAGCATRCGGNEVCADPVNRRCAPICDDACFARPGCGCASTFDTGIDYCNVNPDLGAACATSQCDNHEDCAPGGFCANLFCGDFTSRCVLTCPG
jgi:hypothetical protein